MKRIRVPFPSSANSVFPVVLITAFSVSPVGKSKIRVIRENQCSHSFLLPQFHGLSKAGLALVFHLYQIYPCCAVFALFVPPWPDHFLFSGFIFTIQMLPQLLAFQVVNADPYWTCAGFVVADGSGLLKGIRVVFQKAWPRH